jgi:hypothetical protein
MDGINPEGSSTEKLRFTQSVWFSVILAVLLVAVLGLYFYILIDKNDLQVRYKQVQDRVVQLESRLIAELERNNRMAEELMDNRKKLTILTEKEAEARRMYNSAKKLKDKYKKQLEEMKKE